MSDGNDETKNSRARQSHRQGDASGNSSSSETDDDIPVWLQGAILICILLSVAFLLVAYLVPKMRSSSGPHPQKSEWKQTANKIIETALEQETNNIPELIGHLESSNTAIRRNAEWALYYMTGLPWASKPDLCRTWWNEHGRAVMNGEEPTEPRPEPEEFPRVRPPTELNVSRYFELVSPYRMMISDSNAAIRYERGLVNNSPEEPLRIYPPDVLPYRAYRYGRNIPASVREKNNISWKMAKIPVHLQYGPSVFMVFVEWFRAGSMEKVFRKEFLEFSVLGRNTKTLQPGKRMGEQKSLPLRPPSKLFEQGPHALIRLTLDGRDVLAKRSNEKMRIRFHDRSHTVHLFRANPDRVPGYTKQELTKLKRTGREHGYQLERAERVRVRAFTDSTGIRPEETPATSETSTRSSWTTGSGTLQKPRTVAGSTSHFERDRLIYDQTFSWSRMEEECSPCEPDPQGSHRLHEIRGYAGSYSSSEEARRAIDRHSGRRWVLVFKPMPKDDGAPASSE